MARCLRVLCSSSTNQTAHKCLTPAPRDLTHPLLDCMGTAHMSLTHSMQSQHTQNKDNFLKRKGEKGQQTRGREGRRRSEEGGKKGRRQGNRGRIQPRRQMVREGTQTFL